MNRNFIVIEGIDGSGKTTLIRHLSDRITDLGIPVATAKDPAYYSDRFRSCDDPTERLLLHAAARRRLWQSVISPNLEAGNVVICDRWAKSTIAYQHYGCKLPLEVVRLVTDLSTQGMDDPVEVLLLVDPGVAMKRIASRGDQQYFDRQPQGFYRQVQEGYIRHLSGFAIDSDQPVDDLTDRVMQFLGF